MNAMAPHVSQATRVFGILLAVESGRTVDDLAQSHAVDGSNLADVLDRARNGEMTRVPAYMGEHLPLGRVTSPGVVPGHREEVLVKRWQRRIARELAAHGSIALVRVQDCLGEAGEDSSNAMQRMKAALGPLRTRLSVSNAVSRHPVWSVDDAGRDRLATLIANDWRVEAAK